MKITDYNHKFDSTSKEEDDKVWGINADVDLSSLYINMIRGYTCKFCRYKYKFRDADVSLGEADVSSRGANISSGDADASLGDAGVNSGDADASSGEANVSLGDADVGSWDTDVISDEAVALSRGKERSRDTNLSSGVRIVNSGKWDVKSGKAHVVSKNGKELGYIFTY